MEGAEPKRPLCGIYLFRLAELGTFPRGEGKRKRARYPEFASVSAAKLPGTWLTEANEMSKRQNPQGMNFRSRMAS